MVHVTRYVHSHCVQNCPFFAFFLVIVLERARLFFGVALFEILPSHLDPVSMDLSCLYSLFWTFAVIFISFV